MEVLVAPAGTPPAVVERINQAVQKALSQAATIARVLAMAACP